MVETNNKIAVAERSRSYEHYSDSGVEWLGEIPEHWYIKKVFHFFKAEKGKRAAKLTKEYCESIKGDYPVYSGQTENNGIMSSINEFEFDYSSGGCLFTTTVGAKAMTVNFLQGKFSLSQNCMIIVKRNNEVFNKYVYYQFQTLFLYYRNQIPDHMQASFRMDDLYQYRFLLPPLPEQTAIAKFLDDKTAKIDEAIGIKQQQISLLKERKQILIHKAVTQGLNPNVKLKNSGVEWIGEIPEHWEVKRVKHLLVERTERSKDGEEPLLMMSQIHGLVIRSDFHSKAEVAQSSEGNKIVKTNDLVFNKLKAHLGVFFKSNIEFDGIVSPDYAVYYSKGIISDLKFLELLFRNPEYIKEFIRRSTGIVEGLIRLYTSDLFDIRIAVPPKNEQKEILEYIETASQKIKTAINLKQQEITKLKEYKGSLINSVVTGKLKVY